MTDIASLGIKVSTDGVKQASDDLDKLSASGDKAAASTSNLNKSFTQGGGSGNSVKATTQAVNQQTAALAKLAGQIDPTIAKLDKLDALQAQLGKFKASGAIDTDSFNALNAVIDKNRTAVNGASDAVAKFTLNNANSRRELGYIAKDLATGQYGRLSQSLSTLTVRSGALSLIMSPLGAAIGIAVGAIALFVKGAITGTAASEALRKSVIATGGAAGLAGADFRDISQSIGQATGKYSDAAAAITIFSNNTKVAGASVQTLGLASVNMSRVTGESVAEAAKEILSLGDDPAAAVVKLNDKYNIFTASQYAQIAALQAAGETERATAIAQGIAAEAFQKRTDEVNDGSGTLVRAANSVANAWHSAWNAIDNIGATKSIGDQIKDVQAKIAELGTGHFHGLDIAGAGAGPDDPRVKALQAQLNALNAQQGAHIFDSTNQSTAAFTNQASIAAQKKLSAYNPPDVTLKNKLQEANKELYAALAGVVDPATRELIESQFDQQVKQANDAYQAAINKGIKKPGAAKADPFASLNSQVQKAQVFDAGVGDTKPDDAQVKAILEIVNAGAKLIASGKDVAKVQALVSTGVLALNEGYAKQAAIVQNENVAAINAYQASLAKQNDALQESIDAQLVRITLGTKEAAQQQQLADLTRKNADALTQLQVKRDATKAKGGDTTVLDADIVNLKANMAAQVDIVTNGWSSTEAAQANGLNGVHTALTNFIDETKNNALQMQTITTSFLNGFTDAFAGFVSGTENAKKAFGGLIDSMYEQALKAVANKALSAILTSFGQGGGGFSSLLGNLGSAFGLGNSTGLSAIPTSDPLPMDFSLNAKGGIYNSASLSAYSGKIVSTPTMFAFANGAGIMGEAGNEAILPLRRTSGGKLGVETSGATGGSSGGPVSLVQNIVVQGKMDRRTSSQMAQDSARKQRIAQSRNG